MNHPNLRWARAKNHIHEKGYIVVRIIGLLILKHQSDRGLYVSLDSDICRYFSIKFDVNMMNER